MMHMMYVMSMKISIWLRYNDSDVEKLMLEVDEDDVNEMVHDEFDADAFMIEFDVGEADDVWEVDAVDVGDVANVKKVVMETW